MAALVQTYPQQTTVTMLQSRPSSSGGYSPSQSQQHMGSRNAPPQRYNASSGSGSYRGMPSHGPVAPYAFTSTPQLANTSNSSRQYQTPHLRPENRTNSAPISSNSQQASMPGGPILSAQHRYPISSISNSASSNSLSQQAPRSMDDTSISSRLPMAGVTNRPMSMLGLSMPSSMTTPNSMSPVKPSPDRYRRNVRRVDSSDGGVSRAHHTSAMPSGSGMAAVGHLYNHPAQSTSSPALQSHQSQNYQSFRGTVYNAGDQTRKASVDDMNLARSQDRNETELAKRYRRRSLGSLETAGLVHAEDAQNTPSPHPNAFIQAPTQQPSSRDSRHTNQAHRPSSSHTKTGSSDSISSARSAHSSRPSSVRPKISLSPLFNATDRSVCRQKMSRAQPR